MIKKKLLSLLTAVVLGMGAMQADFPVTASGEGKTESEDSAATTDVTQADVYALRDYLLMGSNPAPQNLPDIDENGAIDVRDLTLAKRMMLNSIHLSNLRADIPDILLNQEETVTFTVKAQGDRLSGATVMLCEENGEPAAEMHDDGKNGDQTANDGVYSAQLKLISDDFKNVDYHAAADNCKSEPFRICFYRELTDDEFLGYGEFAKRFDGMESFTEVMEIIKNAEEVTEYIVDEARGQVSFSTIYHITGCWETPYEESDVLGSGKYAINLDEVEGFHYPYFYAKNAMPNYIVTPAHPDKKDVAVMIPYHTGPEAVESTEIIGVGEVLAQALDSSVTVRYDADVNVRQVANLAQYGTVLWSGHGNAIDMVGDSRNYATPILILGQTLDWDKCQTDAAYREENRAISADFSSNRVSILTSGRIFVNQDFFDHYYEAGSLDDSVWYLGACCSMTTTDLADTLVKKGAESVFGMSEPARVGYSYNVCFEIFLNSMVLSASNAKESVEEAVRIYGHSWAVSQRLWPDGDNIGAYVLHAGNPDFRLVEKIEEKSQTEIPEDPETPEEPETPDEPEFPDDPDFVVDNSLAFFSRYDENGDKYYIVGGLPGNVDVVIPAMYDGAPVKEIRESGFASLKHLRSITLPSSIRVVPEYMCFDCPELKEVNLPTSIVVVDDYAFKDCSSLEYVSCYAGLHEIGEEAFYGCISLTEFTLPGALGSLGAGAFNSCTSLETVSFPKGIEEIGERAFWCCTALDKIELPPNVLRIGAYAFGYTGIREFEYHSDETLEILLGTFYGCENLEKVILDVPVTKLEYTFMECPKLSSLQFPRELKTIGHAFEGNNMLTEIIVPEGVETLEAFAFYSCHALETLILPDSLTTLAQDAVSACGKLTKVVLPENLKEIGKYAFRGDTSLTEVQMPKTLEVIAPSAFENCTALTSLELPDSLKVIDTKAFYGNNKLKLNGHLPASIQTIGPEAFYRVKFNYDNWNLPYLEIPKTMQELDLLAFKGVSNLSALVIHNPEIIFKIPAANGFYSSSFKTVASQLWLYGHPGSTTQTFAEDPAHPSQFYSIEECPLFK